MGEGFIWCCFLLFLFVHVCLGLSEGWCVRMSEGEACVNLHLLIGFQSFGGVCAEPSWVRIALSQGIGSLLCFFGCAFFLSRTRFPELQILNGVSFPSGHHPYWLKCASDKGKKWWELQVQASSCWGWVSMFASLLNLENWSMSFVYLPWVWTKLGERGAVVDHDSSTLNLCHSFSGAWAPSVDIWGSRKP